MLHIVHEGGLLKTGLNVGWCFSKHPWVRFLWKWESANKTTELYFRIRTLCRPWFIFDKKTYSFEERVKHWLWEKNLFLISKELAEDFLPFNKVSFDYGKGRIVYNAKTK